MPLIIHSSGFDFRSWNLERLKSYDLQWLQGWLPCILLAGIVYYISSSLLAWFRLRKFKGPWLASFSYLWTWKVAGTGRSIFILEDVSKKYGPLARIGPNDLLTNDPDIIRRMSAARSAYRRSSWYDSMRLDPYFDNMFSTRDTHAHDRLKAQTAAGYAGKENLELETGIDSQISSLVDLIQTKYVSTDAELKRLELGQTILYFTLDLITKVAYGQEFGFLAKDSDQWGYLRMMEKLIPIMQLQAEIPWVHSILGQPWLQNAVGPKTTDKTGMGRMMGIAKDLVSKRFGPMAKDARDMLGAFVRHGLSQRQCESECLFQIAAGSDTVGTAIRATLFYILSTPRVLHTLVAEIDAAIAAGRVSSPITNEEGKQLPYLQAVIYEGLRIHPPFTGTAPKEVPPAGDVLHGKFVPGGTRIAHSVWSIQRNKGIYGEDVEVFRPERWLGLDREQRALMERTTELVFGYGKWGCSGKAIAFMELNKTFVELLRRFEFQILEPQRPWKSINHLVFYITEMWVRVTERPQESY